MKTTFGCSFVMLVCLTAISPAVAGKPCDRKIRDMDYGVKKTYHIYESPKQWIEAKYFCHSRCQTLATIKSQTERLKLNRAVENSTAGVELWIGGRCTDSYDCTWQNTRTWMDKDFWMEGEPNALPTIHNKKREHMCVYFQKDDKGDSNEKKNLGLDNCKLEKSFVCQSVRA